MRYKTEEVIKLLREATESCQAECDGHWYISKNIYDDRTVYSYEYYCCDYEECNSGDYYDNESLDKVLEYMMYPQFHSNCEWFIIKLNEF